MTTEPQRARPHFIRAVGALLAAVAGMVIALQGRLSGARPDVADRALALGGAVVVLLAGIFAVRSLATGVRRAAQQHAADERGATLAFVVTVIGYGLVLIAVLSALRLTGHLGGLLLGGAITGVVIGIAAQQTLANFFAGIVMVIVRPFTVGESVMLKSGALGGEYQGRVIDMGLYYVTLETETGTVALPNAGVLASAIGPGARSSADEADSGSTSTGAHSR
jgi:small-conductance mechanosensitive channel